MTTTYTLTAATCPAVRVPTVLLPPSAGTPAVAKPLVYGSTPALSLVSFWNENAVRLDLAGRSAGGVFGVLQGLDLDTTGGLSVSVAEGYGFVDGLVYRAATVATVTDNARSYLWLTQAGAVTVLTTTAAPAVPACYLGSVLAAGAVITAIDGSGVLFTNGIPFRKTADAGSPGDTPPAKVRFLTETAGGVYLWTGAAYVLLG